MSGIPAAGAIGINVYHVIAEAVARGCEMGVHRAHKHEDAPSRATIAEAVETAVMGELSDVLIFPEVE